MSSPINAILFHGNCIDGWFSAYIAYSVFKDQGRVNMYPISPNQQNTWPNNNQLAGTHILLVDVSVQEIHRTNWLAAGALSVNCIDHHASAIEHWPADHCPIHTEHCAALQTWKHFYPNYEVPFWLHSIDRIDRWDNPTHEDRCIREVLNLIAHKPVQKKFTEAIILTVQFLSNMNTNEGVVQTIAQGKEILEKKDAELNMILSAGHFHILTQEYINGWNLPQSWLASKVFILDNTGITLDTTAAAHIVFTKYPDTTIFINYRKKILYGQGAMADDKTMYIYSGRSRGFNITEGTIFKGHPTSAGASLIKEDVQNLPFLLVAP